MNHHENFSCIKEFDQELILAERAYNKIKDETNGDYKNHDSYLQPPRGDLILINSDDYWKYLKNNLPCLSLTRLLKKWSKNFAFKNEIEDNWLVNNDTYFELLNVKLANHYNYLQENFADIITPYLTREHDSNYGLKLDKVFAKLYDGISPVKAQDVEYFIKLDFIHNYYKLESMVKESYPKYNSYLTQKKETILKDQQSEITLMNKYLQIKDSANKERLILNQYTNTQIELLYNSLIENKIMETSLDNFAKILRVQPDSNYDQILWTNVIKHAFVTKVSLLELVDKIIDMKQTKIESKSRLINDFIIKYFAVKNNGKITSITKQNLNRTRSSSKESLSENTEKILGIINSTLK